uniref:Retinol dehydrogenase 11 n=2 Tax=Photinus pyralis TaxID=7054 RepID=A0A1Y1LD96_PHOPY
MVLYIITCLLLLLLARMGLKMHRKWNRSYVCLLGKTVIVTGANTGIGFYTAQDFAKRGAKVILACRNRNKAVEAKEKIVFATGNANVNVEIVDFSSFESVRTFAQEILAKEERLDILVNNAGAIFLEDSTTVDGLSTTMQVNYFGPFLLTTLLLDLLKKSAPSRVVNLASVTAHWANLNPDDLNYFSTSFLSQTFYVNYGNAKLCVVLWTNELARQLKNCGVTANSLHPGIIYTDLLRDTNTLVKCLYQILSFLTLKTVEEGAQTSIYVSLSREIENVSGEYFVNCGIGYMPRLARDENLAKRVWNLSEQLVMKNYTQKF